MEMIAFLIVCSLGVVSSLSLYKEGAFTPAPPGVRPPCATKGATFCENVDKYPTKIIQRLLSSKFTSFDDFFTDESEGLDEPPEYLLQEDAVPEDTTGRRKVRRSVDNSSADDLKDLCPVLSKAALPKMAENGEGEWKYIVQDEESKSNQKVVVHLCHQSEECSNLCTQFYAQVPMIYIDKSGTVHKDSFWMPSSCRCNLQPLNDL